MLREDVVDACREGQFHIWPVGTIDAGIELLTSVKAGRLGKNGSFTAGSVHARVAAKLKAITDQLDGKKERDEEAELREKKAEEETAKRRKKRKQ
jgi:hypothetical protein